MQRTISNYVNVNKSDTRFFISILYFWLSLNMLKNCPNFRLKYAYGMLKINDELFFGSEKAAETNNIFSIIDNYLLEV